MKKDFMISAGFLFLMLAPTARGTEVWVPSQRSYEAWNRSQDCSVYRSVIRKNQERREAISQRIKLEKDTLRSKFDALQTCAKAKGLTFNGGRYDETLLAQWCPADYQSWISPGYRLQMLEQDEVEARGEQDSVGNLVNDHCPS